MIRINLLGQARPKATKQAVPLEATIQIIFLLVALGLAAVVLWSRITSRRESWMRRTRGLRRYGPRKQSLQQVKQDVDRFESAESGAAATHRRDRNLAEESHRAVRNCCRWWRTRW